MTKDGMTRMVSDASGDGGVDELTGDSIERFHHLAVAAEQKRCIAIIYGQCGSDNVAQRTVDAIRKQS